LLTIKTKSPEETFQWGKCLASHLPPGIVIALYGELGAGKTVFVKGVAHGLKVQEEVSSPTFTIINEYQGTHPLYHMDAYRLEEEKDLENLGMEEYFYSSGITLIEWPERVSSILPSSYLKIDIQKGWEPNGAEFRILRFIDVGGEWANVIGALEKDENIRD
jgi:tRNA threonylcarbamoyladenosine biosynthesis protein TsaE